MLKRIKFNLKIQKMKFKTRKIQDTTLDEFDKSFV